MIKLKALILAVIMALQAMCCVSVVSAAKTNEKIEIEKFTVSPKKAIKNQKVTFKVKTDLEASKVYIVIDGEYKYNFEKKSNLVWGLEQRFTNVGKRNVKLYVENEKGEASTERVELEILASAEKTETETTEKETETTTKKQTYTEKETVKEPEPEETTEEETEKTTLRYEDLGDFDYEDTNVDDEYLALLEQEDAEYLDKVVADSLFLEVNSPVIYKKGEKTQVDSTNKAVVPFVQNGRTLVPLAIISESLGANTSWVEATKTATIVLNKKSVQITAGSSNMLVDGKVTELDVPSKIVNSRIFLPLRAISEALDKNVYYYEGMIAVTDKTYNLTEPQLKLIKKALM